MIDTKEMIAISRGSMSVLASYHVYGLVDLLSLSIQDFVRAAYHVLLGRLPLATELQARVSVLRSGWGRIRLLRDIAKSEEFLNRHVRSVEQASDEAFVARLYILYLAREPDSSGLAYYVGGIAKGASRKRIRENILRSPEARNASTFWLEFDRLLVDEHKSQHWLYRWLNRANRRQRRHNLELETILAGRPSYAPPFAGSVEVQSQFQASSPLAAAKVDPASLTPGARRMLSRLRPAEVHMSSTWSRH